MGEVVDGRLSIPPLPSRHVRRSRLLVALDVAIERPLTLVAAGPGSGKSVLLSDWATSRALRAAWVSLDLADNGPRRFWPTVATALQVAAGSEVRAARPTMSTIGASAVLAPILERVDSDPVVLILDDAHLLTDRAILRDLDDAVEQCGDRLRLVVAARSDPLLALHRHRRAGRLSELRVGQLAMTGDESSELLAEHGVRLADHDFEVLSARTEGWVAGVRLSAMRMEGVARPSEFVAEFALDRGSVGEYLVEEVLDRQPADVRRLLIETSFLDQVTGPSAAAITGLADAGDMLATLSRMNAFVLPLGRSARTFRYHHLLLEILRYLLRREPASTRRELQRRAARWFGECGEVAAALRYAVEAEDRSVAAAVLARGGFGRALVQRLALDEVSPEQLVAAVAADPDHAVELVLAAAALFVQDGRPDLAREQLDRLADRRVDAELSTTLALVELMIARARLDTAAAEDALTRVLERDEPPGVAAAARLEHAMTCFYGRDHSAVDATLRAAAAEAQRDGAVALRLACVAQLAHVNAIWGRYRIAREHERRARRILRDHPRLEAPATLLFSAATRAFARAEFGTALTGVRQALAADLDRRDVDLRGEMLLLETQVLTTTGRLAEAREAGAVAEPTVGLVAEFDAFVSANVETALGRPNAAVRLLSARGDPTRPSIANVALGRALLARGDLDEAAAALRPILSQGGEAVRTVLVDALVADAQIAHARQQDDDRAVASLLRAIDVADGDYVVPFVCVNEELAELRERHPALEDGWPVPADVSAYLPDLDVPLGPADPVPGEITDRERAVLRWLATTMSTTEIADELCLSVNTVKTHIAAIYRKLDATRRRDAVVRARHLELL